jgi:hypothetical protein
MSNAHQVQGNNQKPKKLILSSDSIDIAPCLHRRRSLLAFRTTCLFTSNDRIFQKLSATDDDKKRTSALLYKRKRLNYVGYAVLKFFLLLSHDPICI